MNLWMEKCIDKIGCEWSVHVSYKEWFMVPSEEKQKVAEWFKKSFGGEIAWYTDSEPVWYFSNLDQAIEFCLVWG